jgi:hypothetical protein
MCRLFAVVLIHAVITSLARAEYDPGGEEPARAQANKDAPDRLRRPSPARLARALLEALFVPPPPVPQRAPRVAGPRVPTSPLRTKPANVNRTLIFRVPPGGPVPINLEEFPVIKGPGDKEEVFEYWIQFFR